MPPDEAEELLRDMDTAARKAATELEEAQGFVEQRKVDAGRLAVGAASSAILELDRAKRQITEGLGSVRRFQAATVKRRRTFFVVAIRDKADQAEASIQKARALQPRLLQGAKIGPDGEATALSREARAVESEASELVASCVRELEE